MVNEGREVETLTKNQKEILEIKNKSNGECL